MYIIEILKKNHDYENEIVKIESFETESQLFKKMQALENDKQYYRVFRAELLFEKIPNID